MQKILQNIDARTIREAGLFLALAGALYIIFKIATNDISHLDASLSEHEASTAIVRQSTNEILRELTRVIESNTRVIESIK